MNKKQLRTLENGIDREESSYTDWEYLENILEYLEDFGCLTREGKKFRTYIWDKHIHKKEALLPMKEGD